MEVILRSQRLRRKTMQKKRVASITCAALLAVAILSIPSISPAQSSEDEPVNVLGSVLLTVLNIPFKLATCLGTQAITIPAYVVTNGVEGNYEGGTNGRQIKEVGYGACAGHWVITPDQLRKDSE
jgi:hypothetical protein